MLTWTQSPAAAGGLGLPAVAAVPLSAASAGAVLSFVLSPAELVKVRRCIMLGVALHVLSLAEPVKVRSCITLGVALHVPSPAEPVME